MDYHKLSYVYLSIEDATMGFIITSIIIIWVVILVLLVSSIVLYVFNTSTCDQVIFPTNDIAQASFTNFQFSNYESRYSMEAIVAYKTRNESKSNTFIGDTKIKDMTDFVIYLIATTDILKSSESLLRIYNHPKYVRVMNDYDTSVKAFKDSSSRSTGIDILVSIIKTDKDKEREVLSKLSDLQLYVKLLPSNFDSTLTPTTPTTTTESTPSLPTSAPPTPSPPTSAPNSTENPFNRLQPLTT